MTLFLPAQTRPAHPRQERGPAFSIMRLRCAHRSGSPWGRAICVACGQYPPRLGTTGPEQSQPDRDDPGDGTGHLCCRSASRPFAACHTFVRPMPQAEHWRILASPATVCLSPRLPPRLLAEALVQQATLNTRLPPASCRDDKEQADRSARDSRELHGAPRAGERNGERALDPRRDGEKKRRDGDRALSPSHSQALPTLCACWW